MANVTKTSERRLGSSQLPCHEISLIYECDLRLTPMSRSAKLKELLLSLKVVRVNENEVRHRCIRDGHEKPFIQPLIITTQTYRPITMPLVKFHESNISI